MGGLSTVFVLSLMKLTDVKTGPMTKPVCVTMKYVLNTRVYIVRNEMDSQKGRVIKNNSQITYSQDTNAILPKIYIPSQTRSSVKASSITTNKRYFWATSGSSTLPTNTMGKRRAKLGISTRQ